MSHSTLASQKCKYLCHPSMLQIRMKYAIVSKVKACYDGFVWTAGAYQIVLLIFTQQINTNPKYSHLGSDEWQENKEKKSFNGSRRSDDNKVRIGNKMWRWNYTTGIIAFLKICYCDLQNKIKILAGGKFSRISNISMTLLSKAGRCMLTFRFKMSNLRKIKLIIILKWYDDISQKLNRWHMPTNTKLTRRTNIQHIWYDITRLKPVIYSLLNIGSKLDRSTQNLSCWLEVPINQKLCLE